MLALKCTIPDFPLPPDAQGIFQRTMGLAFIQPNLRTSLHVCVQQPLCSTNSPVVGVHGANPAWYLVLHEQTDPPKLPHEELACVQQGP